jgi:hypothetical protein
MAAGSKGFGPVPRYLLRVNAERVWSGEPTPESRHFHLAQELFWSALIGGG